MNEDISVTVEQALGNVVSVIREYRGTAREHEILAESVRVLREAVAASVPQPADEAVDSAPSE